MKLLMSDGRYLHYSDTALETVGLRVRQDKSDENATVAYTCIDDSASNAENIIEEPCDIIIDGYLSRRHPRISVTAIDLDFVLMSEDCSVDTANIIFIEFKYVSSIAKSKEIAKKSASKLRKKMAGSHELLRYWQHYTSSFDSAKWQVWVLSKETSALDVILVGKKEEDDVQVKLTCQNVTSPLQKSEFGYVEAGDFISKSGDSIDTKYIERRADEWISRIKDLYLLVTEWVNSEHQIAIVQGPEIPMFEELMKRFNVPQRKMPTLHLKHRGKTVISFEPVGLWIVGANGRIDVVGAKSFGILVDKSEDVFSHPKWVYSTNPHNIAEFTRESVMALIAENS